jgi:hypothetical protein
MPLEYSYTTNEYDPEVFKRIGQGLENPVYGKPLKSRIENKQDKQYKQDKILDKLTEEMTQINYFKKLKDDYIKNKEITIKYVKHRKIRAYSV